MKLRGACGWQSWRSQPGATSLPAVPLKEGESVVSISLVEGEPQHWKASTEQLLVQTKDFPPSTAPRTALVFIASHTGQQVKRAAVGAEGWVLDPFSHQAVATHLHAVGEPLVKAFGSTPPYAIFSDSLEAYGADWTPDLPAEFRRRRGYDLLPHLPELVAGGSAEAEKVRHDWGKTLTELVNENYLSQINTWAQTHHTRFRSQTYGEPAVSLSSQRLVDLAEGEGPHWRAFSTLRWATSANHLFDRNVTSAETFTWLHSPAFRATPLDMKAEVDLHFLIGVNQVIGHGWPYSPPQVGEPGWSLYAAAVFNDHNPWHPVMPDVTRYIERTSFLLRQGQPANQVALLLPTDDAWARFSPGKVSVTRGDGGADHAGAHVVDSFGGLQRRLHRCRCHRKIRHPLSGSGHSSHGPHPGRNSARDSAVRCWWGQGHRGGAGSVAERTWRERAGR